MFRCDASLTAQSQEPLDQAITVSAGRFLVTNIWQAEPHPPLGLSGTSLYLWPEPGKLEKSRHIDSMVTVK